MAGCGITAQQHLFHRLAPGAGTRMIAATGTAPLVVENRAAMTFSVKREVFVSREILEREQRALFDHCWIYVGHASELKSPGDFRTRWAAGRPIIFCRDRAGEIRCLINTCRHRGAMVCREREGNARNFYCIYHGWTYDSRRQPAQRAGRGGLSAELRQERDRPRARRRGSSAIATSCSLNFDAMRADLEDLSRGRQGVYRPRRRPVAVRPDGDHPRHAGIRHPRQLEAAGREQRRRLPPGRARTRPGSTTCAIPASTSRRRRAPACCCRPRRRARISATATR